jgi:ABC-type multidrug transport system fused ATPase/permease subunit
LRANHLYSQASEWLSRLGAAAVLIPESRIPYRGLRTFDEAAASFFFGRAKEIEDLADKLKENSFLAVIGASGSGKSSLVRAGLEATFATPF